MSSVNYSKKSMKWIMPVVLACIVAVLLVFTVPLVLSPARVFGGYTTIGSLNVQTLDTCNCVEETFVVKISGIDPNNVDVASILLAGAPAVNSYTDPDGSLVLVFNPATLSLTNGSTTAPFSGMTKDGTPFSGIIPLEFICTPE